MNKNWIILGIIVIIITIAIFFGFQKLNQKRGVSPPKVSTPKIMEKKFLNKKVVMIVAFSNFRDEEYFVPKEVLESAGIEVRTASNKMGIARGADGGEVVIDLLVSEIKITDFDAVIFIGGPGCLQNLDNEDSYKIAKEAISQDKILAAICISPVILAKAGVLNGKKATVWSSVLDKSAVNILKEKGAIYQDENVVLDGKIITANGPAAARVFGQKIIDFLK